MYVFRETNSPLNPAMDHQCFNHTYYEGSSPIVSYAPPNTKQDLACVWYAQTASAKPNYGPREVYSVTHGQGIYGLL